MVVEKAAWKSNLIFQYQNLFSLFGKPWTKIKQSNKKCPIKSCSDKSFGTFSFLFSTK